MPQMVSISDPWRSSRYVAIPTRKHPTGELPGHSHRKGDSFPSSKWKMIFSGVCQKCLEEIPNLGYAHQCPPRRYSAFRHRAARCCAADQEAAPQERLR